MNRWHLKCLGRTYIWWFRHLGKKPCYLFIENPVGSKRYNIQMITAKIGLNLKVHELVRYLLV